MLADKKLCSGCGACSAICPLDCINMARNEQGFLYPQIDTSKCVGCRKCELACPVLHRRSNNPIIASYAAHCKDESIRRESSSGGIFTLLATRIIQQGGIVFGACFDNTWTVIHGSSETVEDLQKFRGSKYVQSDLRNSFQLVRVLLDAGRMVLFSGTPCQIGGLLSFLEKRYDNLFCLDFICHGVPSPYVWKKYLQEQVQKYRSPIKDISFRDKTTGWTQFSMRINFKSGKAYSEPHSHDTYLKCFLSNLSLRQSCFHCVFKNVNARSDITLADFWGIQDIYPELDDDAGTSLVLVRTKKARFLFESIFDKIEASLVDFENALQYNSAAITSVQIPDNYQLFWDHLNSYSLIKNINLCLTPSLTYRIKQKFLAISRNLTPK